MLNLNGNSYDEVPYFSSPTYPTHPDCLGTLATLMGMKPAAPQRCRVLELGCGTGGNLVPMAESLPGSRFLGIDLSGRQIAAAQTVVRDLGLTNIDFRAQSILEVDEGIGLFDYILCHGVYSWVPAEVQDGILTLCRRHLAPQGVAYISYNTYPGWHERGLVRELLGFHTKQFADPHTRVQEARGFLSFLADSILQPDKPYAHILREELELLTKRQDYYLFHEHLEETNQPLYFHQFAARLAAKGLQYLGEAWGHSTLARFPPTVQEKLRALAGDLLTLEQYIDFLTNRSFRRTLLCHGEVELERSPRPEILELFRIGALARPVTTVDNDPHAAGEFYTDQGISISTNVPLAKTILLELFEVWPATLTLEQLLTRVAVRLPADQAPSPEFDRAGLVGMLLQFYLTNVVSLHLHVPDFVDRAGVRPVARPLARYQAGTGAPIASLRHRVVALNELDQTLLPLLDGSRDRTALIDALLTTIAAGKFTISNKGQPITDGATLRNILQDALEPSLFRLARSALLNA